MSHGSASVRRFRRVSLIVPCFNEEEAISALAARLLPVLEQMTALWAVQLLLVDDGSADRTYDRLLEHFAQVDGIETAVLRHERNFGVGAAMATGFGAATGDAVGTLDCDCTYAPEELPAMFELLESSGADIVTGSPYHPRLNRTRQNGWRLFLSRSASRMYGLLYPAKLHCYTSLFRVYRRPWADPALFRSRGFLAVTEILLAAAARGALIVEHPVSLGVRCAGQSKMRVLRTIFGHLGLMGRIVFTTTEVRMRPLRSMASRGAE
ncbi:MAG: glycosyltransferase family 2 protein [Candidatus Sumerlaeota bacterium]|nr:glycosyltransferase family 2 protein [Candidatus Sumerlaeota bacterium]